MIFGDIKNLSFDNSNYPEAIQKGLEYLNNTDFSILADGKYEIDGESIFARIMEVTTKNKSDQKAESHAKYIDIQFLLSGKEIIGFSPKTDLNIPTDNLLESGDALLYTELKDEMDLLMTPGKYAIFFPFEAHRPGCKKGTDKIRKVVVKVLA